MKMVPTLAIQKEADICTQTNTTAITNSALCSLHNYSIALCMIVAIFLSGCAANGQSFLGVSKRLETGERVSLAGATPIFDSENFEEVDLETLLDPLDIRKSHAYKPENARFCGRDNLATKNINERKACLNRSHLAAATAAFYDPANNNGTNTTQARRNRVLDRLLASSEQRCGAYKQYLKAFDIHWETGLGIGTTLMGAAGAIATGTLNSRAFSGLAAMFSGTRAEVRQGVFSNLASFVIIPGIDQRRAKILDEIRNFRKLSIDDYTVEAALHDAAAYHGACTLETGLEVAQESVRRTDNPGLTEVNKTLAKLAETKQLQRLVDTANQRPLTAAEAKVVSVEYAPQEVVLAGGGSRKKPTAEERGGASAAGLIASIDALSGKAGEVKIAMTTNAGAETDPTKKTKLSADATVLAGLLTAKTADGPHTFISVRTHLATQAAAVAKQVSDLDGAIRSDEILLSGESDAKKRTDGLAEITMRKAARDALGAYAFSYLETTAAPHLKALLAQLDSASPDLAKLKASLAALAAITAPARPS